MEGIYFNFLIVLVFSLIVYLVFFYKLLILKNKNYIKILKIIYAIFVCYWIYNLINKTLSYNTFNDIDYQDVKKIIICDKIVDEKDKYDLFNDLKKDEFTSVEHPLDIRELYIIVVTNNRNFKFKIRKTSNIGILVNRIDINDDENYTNLNNKLEKYIKEYCQ
jgi:hypothetical protein